MFTTLLAHATGHAQCTLWDSFCSTGQQAAMRVSSSHMHCIHEHQVEKKLCNLLLPTVSIMPISLLFAASSNSFNDANIIIVCHYFTSPLPLPLPLPPMIEISYCQPFPMSSFSYILAVRNAQWFENLCVSPRKLVFEIPLEHLR